MTKPSHETDGDDDDGDDDDDEAGSDRERGGNTLTID